MAEPQDDVASAGDVSDDGRAAASTSASAPVNADSAWTSRRGKARCDSCRLRNLKCDRILPTCNQCRWTPVTDCTYTPLPTPAHRGVPRCDRCRESNLKCDRAAPVCQYCREGNITDCRYTPKKRARLPAEHTQPLSRVPYNTQASSASFMFTNISGPVESGPSFNRPFVNENIQSVSGTHRESRTIDINPPYQRTTSFSEGPPLALLPAPGPPSTYPAQPFISHSFPEPPLRSSQFKPWVHPSFIPLPEPMLRRLNGLRSTEMPSREEFDQAFEEFLSKLMPDLRETATLAPEIYATLANCLAKGNITRLSTRLRAWATCHRLSSGSNKSNLILAPKDGMFGMSDADELKLVNEYRAAMDQPPKAAASGEANGNGAAGAGGTEGTQSQFERVPVQPQIYDCLAYAHRGHASSVAVLMEIRRLGIASITWPMAEIFISLCPLCKVAPGPAGAGGSASASASPAPKPPSARV
ncbi:hypothetical protein FB45DRAFT_948129 [Roridomyces roridus]|uniref:Zn(2)-C6 fungal-type domain-containing protein n=1 Tax=Roridomyces roridus TaxID=1738132 RepID=A0AAD7F9Y2_9AGAR|nr:hypothetical protein FB45DRAFT_948129 [Roridomyces roridus]